MATAAIKINAVLGSDTNLPIGSVVQLSNNDNTGVVTWLWSILDQPPSITPPDALSATNVAAPTFTISKEGTYLIQLIVNQSLPSEDTNRVVAAVLQLKTRERVPAAGEDTESDSNDGWATAANANLRALDAFRADPGTMVGVAGVAGTISRGSVVRLGGPYTLKSGLPGQELVPSFLLASGITAPVWSSLLGVVEGDLSGGSGPFALNTLINVRVFGMCRTPFSLTGVAGDPVYVDFTTGAMSTTVTSNYRQVGLIASVPAPGTAHVFVDTTRQSYRSTVGGVEADDLKVQGEPAAGAVAFTRVGAQTVKKTGGGSLSVGTETADSLVLRANATDSWAVLSSGALAAQGGNRRINNVQDPGSAQDAATKNYVDSIFVSDGLTSGEQMYVRPRQPVTAAQGQFNALVTLVGGAFWVDRPTAADKLTFRTTAATAGATVCFQLFQKAKGLSGTALRVATIQGQPAGVANTNFEGTFAEGVVGFYPGLLWVLWGKDLATNTTLRVYGTDPYDLLDQNIAGLPYAVEPYQFTTALAANVPHAAIVPSSFTVSATDCMPIIRLRRS